jgi:hypothetical protein
MKKTIVESIHGKYVITFTPAPFDKVTVVGTYKNTDKVISNYTDTVVGAESDIEAFKADNTRWTVIEE